MVNMSKTIGTNITKQIGNGMDTLNSANNTLKNYVEYMIHTDKRFVGLSSYIFNINFYWTTSISTACAGHGFIFFNPDFWNQLSEEKKKTVVAHEIWHLVLDHLNRGIGFDPDDYNKAADYVINNGLDDDGFNLKGDFAGITPCFDQKYSGMSTEQVYKIIHQERKEDPKKHKPDPNTPSKDQIEDLIEEVLNDTGKDLQQQIEENNQAREDAVSKSLQAGTSAGNTQIILSADGQKVFIKESSYEDIFEKYLIDPLSGGKRTYMRPSRRQAKGGLRLKGKHPKQGKKNRLTKLVYALDVSGSVTTSQRQQFIRSADTMKKRLNPKEMIIILWGSNIVFEKTFSEHEDIGNIKNLDGGGTNLNPVYKRVKEINPEALIVFTDLEFTMPPKPDWDSIWFVDSLHVSDHYLQRATYGDVYLIPKEE